MTEMIEPAAEAAKAGGLSHKLADTFLATALAALVAAGTSTLTREGPVPLEQLASAQETSVVPPLPSACQK